MGDADIPVGIVLTILGILLITFQPIGSLLFPIYTVTLDILMGLFCIIAGIAIVLIRLLE